MKKKKTYKEIRTKYLNGLNKKQATNKQVEQHIPIALNRPFIKLLSYKINKEVCTFSIFIDL